MTGIREADVDAIRQALAEFKRDQAVRAVKARARLREILAAALANGGARRPGKMKVISIHLEDWQIEAAKLVTDIHGGSYQEWIRTWVVAGLLVESRSGRKPAP